MFRFLRALVPLRQPILRPYPSLLRHDGNIQVQRVRFVRKFLTRKWVLSRCMTGAGLATNRKL